jgi:inner membrane protein
MIEKPQNIFQRNAVTIKIIIIFFLAVALMIPMEMIRSIKSERQERQEDAFREISSKWGKEQIVTGPVLTIPFTHYDLNEKNEPINVRNDQYYILPDQLKVQTEMIPETRSRGIFKVVVYRSVVKLTGSFPAELPVTGTSQTMIDLEKARISLGITDIKGISDSVVLQWNGEKLISEPGVDVDGLFASGFSVATPLSNLERTEDHHFSIEINLNGSRNMGFTPVGKETYVEMVSSWPDPSFTGAFLPSEREITDDGFIATWKILEYNRNFPQIFTHQSFDISESVFGVDLILPVDNYQVVERSMKYAILFFVFTFMVFFFMEILKKQKVHPLQYALVGFALTLFYLLLLSLAEQVVFGIAYLIASAGIMVLITAYSRAIFKSKATSAIMLSFLVLVYGILYILLQMQDYVLLLGSAFLFIALAAAMYISLKIDWEGN